MIRPAINATMVSKSAMLIASPVSLFFSADIASKDRQSADSNAQRKEGLAHGCKHSFPQACFVSFFQNRASNKIQVPEPPPSKNTE